VKIEQVRQNVFALTLTSQELSALIAAGRMAHDAMRDDPQVPPEAVAFLERLLEDYERAIARLRETDGRQKRPS
jgi:hypothetical protein